MTQDHPDWPMYVLSGVMAAGLVAWLASVVLGAFATC